MFRITLFYYGCFIITNFLLLGGTAEYENNVFVCISSHLFLFILFMCISYYVSVFTSFFTRCAHIYTVQGVILIVGGHVSALFSFPFFFCFPFFFFFSFSYFLSPFLFFSFIIFYLLACFPLSPTFLYPAHAYRYFAWFGILFV